MKRIVLPLVLLASVAAQANNPADATAAPFILSGASTYVVGYLTLQAAVVTTAGPFISTIAISGGQYKVLKAAQEDAGFFIATEGDVRTANLQNALNLVRELAPAYPGSDIEIAQSILAL
jgi:Protein of unknown function (DUF2388).